MTDLDIFVVQHHSNYIHNNYTSLFLCFMLKVFISQYCGDVISIYLQSSFTSVIIIKKNKINQPPTCLTSRIPLDELSGIFVELILLSFY